MWVNVDSSLSIPEIVAYLQSLSYSGQIYLSLNSVISAKQAEEFLRKLAKECENTALNISWGPHFIEEGILQESQITIFDNLYFFTSSEKIIWYMANFAIPDDITTIILLADNLGIEPIITKMKNKDSQHYYYFVQKDPISLEVSELLKNTNYKLSRIKE